MLRNIFLTNCQSMVVPTPLGNTWYCEFTRTADTCDGGVLSGVTCVLYSEGHHVRGTGPIKPNLQCDDHPTGIDNTSGYVAGAVVQTSGSGD